MDDQKRLDLNLLKEITGESRVKLASPDLLRKNALATWRCLHIWALKQFGARYSDFL